MDLSIIVVFSQEAKDILLDCLGAIEKSYSPLTYEIILINNSNEDLRFLKGRFPNIDIIDNRKNIGIAIARNQGVKKAKAGIIIFIDPDIIVKDEAIEQMHKYLVEHPNVDGLAPKIVLPDGELQYNFGQPPSLIYPLCEIINIPINKQRQAQEGFHNFLGFGGLMLRKDAWFRTGECDENFFYGFEDTDWCKRAKSKGIKLLYYPKAHALHLLHQSVKFSGARQVDFYISEVYYYKKHYGNLIAYLLRIFIVSFSCLRLIISFIKPKSSSKRNLIKRLIKKMISNK